MTAGRPVKMVDDQMVRPDPWLATCLATLGPHPLPLHQDDVLAALVRAHAPSRVLQQVAALGPALLYQCLDDVRAVCEGDPAPDGRAELLPEEEAAGSDDPQAQARAILAESQDRTEHPERTRHDSVQTPDRHD